MSILLVQGQMKGLAVHIVVVHQQRHRTSSWLIISQGAAQPGQPDVPGRIHRHPGHQYSGWNNRITSKEINVLCEHCVFNGHFKKNVSTSGAM